MLAVAPAGRAPNQMTVTGAATPTNDTNQLSTASP
jgi:hypothetical protein